MLSAAVVQAVIFIVCLGLAFWLLDRLIDYVEPKEPFGKVAHVLLAVAAVVILISILLGLAGLPLWR